MKVEGQGITTCPKCGCAAWSWSNPDGWGLDCMTCGHWHHAERDDEDKEGGGFGVTACQEPDQISICWFPLEEAAELPFTPEEQAQMAWAWYSRPVGDCRWEGIALKGTTPHQWVVGIIPHYQEEDNRNEEETCS